MLNRWVRSMTSTVERGGHRVGQIIKTLFRPVRTTAALTSAAALDAVRPARSDWCGGLIEWVTAPTPQYRC